MKRLSAKLASHERKLQALELRKAGASFQAIADRLGYRSASGAYAAVKAALRDTLREPAQELRELELARLDSALLAIWRRVQDGDDKAIDRLLGIMKRRSELLGLDRKPRPEPEAGDGHAIVGRQNLGAKEIAIAMDATLLRYQAGRIDGEQARNELLLLQGQMKAVELTVLDERLTMLEAQIAGDSTGRKGLDRDPQEALGQGRTGRQCPRGAGDPSAAAPGQGGRRRPRPLCGGGPVLRGCRPRRAGRLPCGTRLAATAGDLLPSLAA